MKRLIITALVITIMTSCTQKENSKSNTNTIENTETMEKQEKQKIETLLSEYEKSLNTSNAKLAQSLYTKDGIFMPTEAPSGIGSEGILKSYEYVFSQIQLNIKFFIEEIQVEGNMAFAVTSSKGTTLIKVTGDTIPEANRELFVFEKVNGEWRIARYMFNKTEPKP
jgi:uncharacterized protein (TIGR02246 family)